MITVAPVTDRAQRRIAAGITLTAMAARLGISKAYLSQFEHNVRNGTRTMRDVYAALPPARQKNGKKKRGRDGGT